MSPILGFLNSFLGPDGLILIVIAILLFYGRNLPGVGRSLGKGISEFRKGLKGLEDDVESGTSGTGPRTEAPPVDPPKPPQRIGQPAPRFDEWPKQEEKPKDEEKPDEQKPRYS
jgi:sec-independent protein translocase protein TatA